MQLTQDQLQKKNEEVIEMYQEKCKKHTQMTNLYNLLKSRAMRSQIQTAASDSVSQTLQSLPRMDNNNTQVPMPGMNNFTSNGSRPMVPQSTRLTSRHFNALPSPGFQTLSSGAERLSRHQRSGGASSREKQGRLGIDLESMPPPKLPFAGKFSLYIHDKRL
jgi:E3 ubiquitin-protein ligase CCNP1IP1